MKRNRGKSLKYITIVLSILLALSIMMLVVFLFCRSKAAPETVSAAVTDNYVNIDEENTAESVDSADLADSIDSVSGISGNDPSDSLAGAEAVARAESANDADHVDISHTTNNGMGGVSTENLPQIGLYRRHAEDNEPFQVTNMFPGDTVTKYFCVKVSYKGDVVVRYRADIRPGGEKLAEVLGCRVVLLTTGETLYDGLMRDMPGALEHKLTTGSSTSTELYYEITAYLDTSVGNEYMNRNLTADFRWWVEETDNLDAVKTGDTTPVWLWVVLALAAAAAVLVLILYRKKRTKEVRDESGK